VLLGELGGAAGDLGDTFLQAAVHVHGPGPVPEVPADLAEDGRSRVRGELEAATGVEPVDGLDQADRPGLEQVVERLAAAVVPAGDVADQRQVPLDEHGPQSIPLGTGLGQFGQADEVGTGGLTTRARSQYRSHGDSRNAQALGQRGTRRAGGSRGLTVSTAAALPAPTPLSHLFRQLTSRRSGGAGTPSSGWVDAQTTWSVLTPNLRDGRSRGDGTGGVPSRRRGPATVSTCGGIGLA